MSFLLPLSYFLSGLFMKISDDEYDVKGNKLYSLIFGLVCAVFAAYATVTNADAAYIFIAILIGNFIALKVDGLHHIITLIFFVIICFIFGIPDISIWILIICILAAFFDEIGHDKIGNFVENKYVNLFFEYRCVMKVVILLLAIFGVFDLWTFIFFILFECGYELAGLIFSKLNQ